MSARTLPATWNGEDLPIAREVVLDIPSSDWRGRRSSGSVQEQPVSGGLTPVRSFIETILPGHKVEHTGRENLLGLARYGTIGSTPSNLLFQAVHQCFANHHALALRPEVLMHLVMTQVAELVKSDPDRFRDMFTSSDQVEIVRVRHDGLRRGDSHSPWHEAISMFHPAMRKMVPGEIIDDMLFPFSMDTQEAQIARLIAFMDAASPYYDYRTHTMCGIPRIRMLGEPGDWTLLHEAVERMSRLFSGLERYFQHLLPVTDKLALQATGDREDHKFWTSIYKHKSASGTSNCNGWITAFVNYITGDDGKVTQKMDNTFDWQNIDTSGWGMPGIDEGSVPTGISNVPFIWEYMGTSIPMAFLGGVLGVDDVDGCACPSLSYAVVERPA